MFDVLTSANRFALIHRVESMKRAESRARKITEMVQMLARGETLYPQKAGHPGRAGQGGGGSRSPPVQRTNNATEPGRRRRWTSTGTALGTAARLEQIVDRLVGAVLSLHPTNRGVLAGNVLNTIR